MSSAAPAPLKEPSRLVFVFSTRGTQWIGMGQQLYQTNALFRETLQRCSRVVAQCLGWSLAHEYMQDAGHYRLHACEEYLEPTLVATQIALVALYRAAGVWPQAVVGMSGGEFTAAYVAGALGLEDTMRVACSVSRVIGRRLGLGSMISANVSLADVEELRRMVGKPVYITAEYAPAVTILAGEKETIATIMAILNQRNVEYRLLPWEFAFHSALVDGWLPEFKQRLRSLSPRAATLPVYSATCGGRLRSSSLDAWHWWQVVRRPAFYARAVRCMLQDGYNTFLEIGPHPLLSRPIREEAAILGKHVVILPSLQRDQPGDQAIRASLQTLQAYRNGLIRLKSSS